MDEKCRRRHGPRASTLASRQSPSRCASLQRKAPQTCRGVQLSKGLELVCPRAHRKHASAADHTSVSVDESVDCLDSNTGSSLLVFKSCILNRPCDKVGATELSLFSSFDPDGIFGLFCEPHKFPIIIIISVCLI